MSTHNCPSRAVNPCVVQLPTARVHLVASQSKQWPVHITPAPGQRKHCAGLRHDNFKRVHTRIKREANTTGLQLGSLRQQAGCCLSQLNALTHQPNKNLTSREFEAFSGLAALCEPVHSRPRHPRPLPGSCRSLSPSAPPSVSKISVSPPFQTVGIEHQYNTLRYPGGWYQTWLTHACAWSHRPCQQQHQNPQKWPKRASPIAIRCWKNWAVSLSLQYCAHAFWGSFGRQLANIEDLCRRELWSCVQGHRQGHRRGCGNQACACAFPFLSLCDSCFCLCSH